MQSFLEQKAAVSVGNPRHNQNWRRNKDEMVFFIHVEMQPELLSWYASTKSRKFIT